MTTNCATIVADLGFGDAGKGSIIDYLARKGRVSAVVRFNGGAQAAHNVITPAHTHHTFSQFGSGTFVPGVRTHLSRFMLVDPVALCEEAHELKMIGIGDPIGRMSIDARALVVTPFHRIANHLREALRGSGAHGSCGMGIGETMNDALTYDDSVFAGDLRNVEVLVKKCLSIQERKRNEFKEYFRSFPNNPFIQRELHTIVDPSFVYGFADATRNFCLGLTITNDSYLKSLASQGNLLFEGAQGVLLDEWYGFHPHTTWSTTTFANALSVLSEIGYEGAVEKLGVLRGYYTRHGQGPFPTEDDVLTKNIREQHNGNAGMQGKFRVGWFDAVLARYALDVCGGVDTLAITNLDRMPEQDWKFATAYIKRSSLKVYDFIRRLPVKPFLTDLAHQESLTALLDSVTPVYNKAPGTVEAYLDGIEAALSVPISITSYGAAAHKKQMRTPLKSVAQMTF